MAMMSAATQTRLAPLELGRRETANEIVRKTVRACEQRYGSRLRAVILTGSLARDEATVLCSDGRHRVLGDADFLLTFNRKAKLPSAAEIKSLGEEVTDSLERQGVTCTVHLAAVRPSYVARLPAHIFSYELRHTGRVVFGDEGILELVPEFSPAQMDREDAWRLLSNRMIEWLETSGFPSGLSWRVRTGLCGKGGTARDPGRRAGGRTSLSPGAIPRRRGRSDFVETPARQFSRLFIRLGLLRGGSPLRGAAVVLGTRADDRAKRRAVPADAMRDFLSPPAAETTHAWLAACGAGNRSSRRVAALPPVGAAQSERIAAPLALRRGRRMRDSGTRAFDCAGRGIGSGPLAANLARIFAGSRATVGEER
jgi:hypothetical protein